MIFLSLTFSFSREVDITKFLGSLQKAERSLKEKKENKQVEGFSHQSCRSREKNPDAYIILNDFY